MLSVCLKQECDVCLCAETATEMEVVFKIKFFKPTKAIQPQRDLYGKDQNVSTETRRKNDP